MHRHPESQRIALLPLVRPMGRPREAQDGQRPGRRDPLPWDSALLTAGTDRAPIGPAKFWYDAPLRVC